MTRGEGGARGVLRAGLHRRVVRRELRQRSRGREGSCLGGIVIADVTPSTRTVVVLMVAGSALVENTTWIGALMATPVTPSGGVVATTVNGVPRVGSSFDEEPELPHAAMARSGSMERMEMVVRMALPRLLV